MNAKERKRKIEREREGMRMGKGLKGIPTWPNKYSKPLNIANNDNPQYEMQLWDKHNILMNKMQK